jgi:hypothetical protein
LSLLMLGKFEEHDALVEPRVEHHRTHGPPTCLAAALTQLGLSASLQGRHHDAWQRFDEASRAALPERTHSLGNPFDARTALRRGDRAGACRSLCTYIDGLRANDNLYMATLACVEFVNLMTTTGHPAEALRVLRHLDAAGSLDGSLPWRTLVADSAAQLPGSSDDGADVPLDDRQALLYMRDALQDLA